MIQEDKKVSDPDSKGTTLTRPEYRKPNIINIPDALRTLGPGTHTPHEILFEERDTGICRIWSQKITTINEATTHTSICP